MKIKTKSIKFLLAAAIVALPLFLVVLTPAVQGANLTTTYVRLDRLKTGQTTSFRLVFKAATTQTANVTVDFQSAWTSASGTVNATQSVSTATCASETGFTALPGGSLTAAGSGTTVTVSGVGSVTAGTTYCVDLTSASAVTNPTAGEYNVVVGHGSDSVTTALRVISEDSYAVTATVTPSFNFAFNNTTTDALGNLSTTGTSSTGKTITLTTNANSGWIVWAKSATSNGGKGSLNSVTAGNYKITPSAAVGSASHTLTSSTEDYGLAVTVNTDASGGGTVALDAAYDGSSTKVGVLDAANFRPIASSNGTANGDIINVLERATIKGDTPAANDYADTLTFIGAGNF